MVSSQPSNLAVSVLSVSSGSRTDVLSARANASEEEKTLTSARVDQKEEGPYGYAYDILIPAPLN